MNAIQLMTLASALSLEVNTGLKASSRWSTLTMAKRYGYTGKQRKVEALVWCVETMMNNDLPVSPTLMKTLEENGYTLDEA